MSKSSFASKSAPLVIPVRKTRNPFGVGTGMAKAGSHAKTEKAQRNVDNNATRNAAMGVVNSRSRDEPCL